MMIEAFFEKSYWVVDILPKQAPTDCGGQYFRVEEYYLRPPQIEVIYRNFTNILLKMNCFMEMDFSSDGETWMTNPSPQDIVAMTMKCLSDNGTLYVIIKPSETMVTLFGGDTNMTVYGPTEGTLGLLRSLAASEGLFVWKPDNNQRCAETNEKREIFDL